MGCEPFVGSRLHFVFLYLLRYLFIFGLAIMNCLIWFVVYVSRDGKWTVHTCTLYSVHMPLCILNHLNEIKETDRSSITLAVHYKYYIEYIKYRYILFFFRGKRENRVIYALPSPTFKLKTSVCSEQSAFGLSHFCC